MTQFYKAIGYYGQSQLVMQKVMEEAVEQYVDDLSQVAYSHVLIETVGQKKIVMNAFHPPDLTDHRQ